MNRRTAFKRSHHEPRLDNIAAEEAQLLPVAQLREFSAEAARGPAAAAAGLVRRHRLRYHRPGGHQRDRRRLRPAASPERRRRGDDARRPSPRRHDDVSRRDHTGDADDRCQAAGGTDRQEPLGPVGSPKSTTVQPAARKRLAPGQESRYDKRGSGAPAGVDENQTKRRIPVQYLFTWAPAEIFLAGGGRWQNTMVTVFTIFRQGLTNANFDNFAPSSLFFLF